MKEIRSEVAGVRGGSDGKGPFSPTAEGCSGTHLCKAKEEQTEKRV